MLQHDGGCGGGRGAVVEPDTATRSQLRRNFSSDPAFRHDAVWTDAEVGTPSLEPPCERLTPERPPEHESPERPPEHSTDTWYRLHSPDTGQGEWLTMCELARRALDESLHLNELIYGSCLATWATYRSLMEARCHEGFKTRLLAQILEQTKMPGDLTPPSSPPNKAQLPKLPELPGSDPFNRSVLPEINGAQNPFSMRSHLEAYRNRKKITNNDGDDPVSSGSEVGKPSGPKLGGGSPGAGRAAATPSVPITNPQPEPETDDINPQQTKRVGKLFGKQKPGIGRKAPTPFNAEEAGLVIEEGKVTTENSDSQTKPGTDSVPAVPPTPEDPDEPEDDDRVRQFGQLRKANLKIDARGDVGHESFKQKQERLKRAQEIERSWKNAAREFSRGNQGVLIEGHPYAPCNGIYEQKDPDESGLPRYQNSNHIMLYCRGPYTYYLNDRYEPNSFKGYAFGYSFFDMSRFVSGKKTLTTNIWVAEEQEWHTGSLALTLLNTQNDIDAVPRDRAGPFEEPVWALPAKGEALQDKEDAEWQERLEKMTEKDALHGLKKKKKRCMWCSSCPDRADSDLPPRPNKPAQIMSKVTTIRPLPNSNLWVATDGETA